MKVFTRRAWLRLGVLGGLTCGLVRKVQGKYMPTLHPTPSEVMGPFYPVIARKDKDFDLTRIMDEMVDVIAEHSGD